MPIAAGAFVLLAGGLIGWLATQEPPPETLPYYITLPIETPAETDIAEIPAEEPDESITMSAVEATPHDGEAVTAGGASQDAGTTTAETVTGVPAATAGAQSLNSIALGARSSVMQPTPHPALIEQGRYGLMPIISADGREAWQVYARPFNDSDPSPLIALVIVELGMSRANSHNVLRLPGVVTFAFSPYAEGLEEWVRQARSAGHEVLLEVPME